MSAPRKEPRARLRIRDSHRNVTNPGGPVTDAPGPVSAGGDHRIGAGHGRRRTHLGECARRERFAGDERRDCGRRGGGIRRQAVLVGWVRPTGRPGPAPPDTGPRRYPGPRSAGRRPCSSARRGRRSGPRTGPRSSTCHDPRAHAVSNAPAGDQVDTVREIARRASAVPRQGLRCRRCSSATARSAGCRSRSRPRWPRATRSTGWTR